MAHPSPTAPQALDQWLDTLEQQWHEPPSTLTEVTATVWDWRQQLTGGITETIVAHVHRGAHDCTQVTWPRCDGMLRARERVCRTVETMWGQCSVSDPISIVGPVAWAAIPSMKRWGRGGYKQLDMHKAAAQLVTEVPYDTAQALFSRADRRAVWERTDAHRDQPHGQELTVLDVAPPPEENPATRGRSRGGPVASS